MKWENDTFLETFGTSGIAERCTKHGVDYPTFDKWYRKTHKKVYPVTVKGIPSVEETEIQTEAEKVSEERWKKTS